LVVLGFWSQASPLQDRCSTTLATLPTPFALVIFHIRSLTFSRPASGHKTNASCVAGMTGMHHHKSLICHDGVLLTFSLDALELNSLVSTSLVAGITGMYCYSQRKTRFGKTIICRCWSQTIIDLECLLVSW
jgi:hypothetical protein